MDSEVTEEEARIKMDFCFSSTAGIHLIGHLRQWKNWVPSSFWMITPQLLFLIRCVSCFFTCGRDSDAAQNVLCFCFSSFSSIRSAPSWLNASFFLGFFVLFVIFSLFLSFSAMDERHSLFPKVETIPGKQSSEKENLYSDHLFIKCST